MGDLMSRSEVLECERVVRDVEVRVEKFMAIEDGEGLVEISDGVQSVLIGSLSGKAIQITIHVQPVMKTSSSRVSPTAGACDITEKGD